MRAINRFFQIDVNTEVIMIRISLLENKTIETLKNAGWYEGRQANIAEWIAQLKKEGFQDFPYAIKILTELGGIYVEPERIKTGEFIPGIFNFHAYYAGSGEFDRLEIFEAIANDTLFPLGMAFDQMFFYVGKSKRIYIGDGNMTRMLLIADNIEDALNNLILGKKKFKELK
jgi:hypothetical protein